MKLLCIFLMTMLLCCASLSFAQDMRARTITGETVMLRKNGTWFARDPSAAHGDTAVTFNGQVLVLLPDRTWSMTALKRSPASLPRPSAPSSSSTPKSADGGTESFVSMVGQRVSAFLFRDANNALVDINQYSGKVVLINFWTTWCRPLKM